MKSVLNDPFFGVLNLSFYYFIVGIGG